MAMTKLSENKKKGTRTVEISNGDLKALNEIVEKWGFKDVESALRFGVAVMTLSEDSKLYYDNKGEKVMVRPTELLKAEKTNAAE
jgi:hypothetical protein